MRKKILLFMFILLVPFVSGAFSFGDFGSSVMENWRVFGGIAVVLFIIFWFANKKSSSEGGASNFIQRVSSGGGGWGVIGTVLGFGLWLAKKPLQIPVWTIKGGIGLFRRRPRIMGLRARNENNELNQTVAIKQLEENNKKLVAHEAELDSIFGTTDQMGEDIRKHEIQARSWAINIREGLKGYIKTVKKSLRNYRYNKRRSGTLRKHIYRGGFNNPDLVLKRLQEYVVKVIQFLISNVPRIYGFDAFLEHVEKELKKEKLVEEEIQNTIKKGLRVDNKEEALAEAIAENERRDKENAARGLRRIMGKIRRKSIGLGRLVRKEMRKQLKLKWLSKKAERLESRIGKDIGKQRLTIKSIRTNTEGMGGRMQQGKITFKIFIFYAKHLRKELKAFNVHIYPRFEKLQKIHEDMKKLIGEEQSNESRKMGKIIKIGHLFRKDVSKGEFGSLGRAA